MYIDNKDLNARAHTPPPTPPPPQHTHIYKVMELESLFLIDLLELSDNISL